MASSGGNFHGFDVSTRQRDITPRSQTRAASWENTVNARMCLIKNQDGNVLVGVYPRSALCGKSHIVHDVSAAVNVAEIVARLRLNGSGKTTTLRGLVGLSGPRAGTVSLRGRDTTSCSPHVIAALAVDDVPEGKAFADPTAEEKLLVPAGALRALGSSEGVLRARRRECRHTMGGRLSGELRKTQYAIWSRPLLEGLSQWHANMPISR